MRRVGLAAVVLLAGIGATSFAPPMAQDGVAVEPGSVERGAEIFVAACATCHGSRGEGTADGPQIANAGEASADFQLRTGRMPRAQPPGGQSLPKPPAFGEQEIRDLVAYVGSLGSGPPIPDVDRQASVSDGMKIFVTNCAPCHGATGAGGAVGDGWFAPALDGASPRTVAEAMLVGPGQMPAFDLPNDDVSAVAAYVEYLRTSAHPGGLSIGNIGPVPEGFVGWLVGMGLLGLLAYLVGREWTRAG